ncbi:MAG TPA: polysaccharide biosynthesis tyrosine autokinase [Actinomycetota bacterium]
MTGPDQHTSDLRDYVRVLMARKYEIAIVTGLVFIATAFLTFRQTPMYQGVTKVLVKPVQNPATSLAIAQQPNLDTERELVLSEAVARKVQENAKVSLSVSALLRHARVQVLTDTEVMEVKYVDPDPATAARLANAFATAYVEFRSEQTLDQFQAAAVAVQRRIDGIQESLSSLNQKIQETKDPSSRATLQAQRDALVASLGVLQERLLDVQSNASVAQGGAQIVQRADQPRSPVSPNKRRDAALALLAGLALGIGLAFLRERLDDRVKTRQEIERRLGAPVIAVVPRIGTWRRNDAPQLVMRSNPKSPVSEAYRTLGTNILYAASQQPLKVLMVTSSLGGDGKSTTSSNLAVALARAGKRVIVVSADLRRPRLHDFFGLPNDVGLSNLLSDSIRLARATKDPGIPNLRVIGGGPIPHDPAALLGGRRAEEFVRSVREVSDFVIIDTPPVLAVADASILAPHVDGAVFVLNAERSSRSALIQARDQLEQAGAHIIGAVYNNFDPSQSTAYPYYYSYYKEDRAAERGSMGGKRAKFGDRRRQSRYPSSDVRSGNGSGTEPEGLAVPPAELVSPEGREGL